MFNLEAFYEKEISAIKTIMLGHVKKHQETEFHLNMDALSIVAADVHHETRMKRSSKTKLWDIVRQLRTVRVNKSSVPPSS